MLAFLASPLAKIVGVGALLLALAGAAIYVIDSLEAAGGAEVQSEVDNATTKAVTDAVKEKAKVDEKVRNTPDNDVIDDTK